MAYDIKFSCLQKPELEYEVYLRGGVKSNTVEELRKQISKLALSLPSEDLTESYLSTEEDLQAIKFSLFKANNNIKMLTSNFEKNLLTRTESLLHHIYHRLNRICLDNLPDISLIDTLWNEFHTLYSSLKLLTSPPTRHEPQTDCSVESISLSTPISALTYERKLFSELAKFKYDGRSCVRAFIQKINEFMSSRNIPEDKIISFAFEIFSEDALTWYRSIKDSVSSWSQLCQLLKGDFSPHNYDYKLLSEIRLRSQGFNENITLYIAKMQGLFSRLDTPISESEKLEILLNNIRPCYTNSLLTTNVVDIPSLIKACKNFEKYDSRNKDFREPPRTSSNTLAPEFAYNYPPSNNSNGNSNNFYKQNFYNKYSNNKNKQYYKPPRTTPATQVNVVKGTSNDVNKFCPRCRTTTHSLTECRQPRYLICFKCGLKGFRVADCPNCNHKPNISPSKN